MALGRENQFGNDATSWWLDRYAAASSTNGPAVATDSDIPSAEKHV